jgi:beta-galactosidase
MDVDDSKYDLVIAPFLYMLKDGTIDGIEEYVKNGGNFVTTYLSGVVDTNDMCYLGGFPAGKLKDVFGIWAEETDSLPEGMKNSVSYKGKNYDVVHVCDLVHAQGAEALATYEQDFYKGMASLTENTYGRGKAYYAAFRNDDDFTKDFCNDLMEKIGITPDADITLPQGVTMRKRGDTIFLMNFADEERIVTLPKEYKNIVSGEAVSGDVALPVCGYMVVE